MNAHQMALFNPKHLNRGLFSDYYLDEIIRRRDDWRSLADEARPIYEALRNLLDQIHLEELDEAQLENQWIQKVFERLGHHYSVQVKIRFQQTGHRKPDYVFTRTAEEAHALTSQIYTPQDLRRALAVGDAKKWGINLDQSGPGQRNPSQQIDEYLRYSELPWGILTDGRYWRLYERETSKNNVYYAVDLINLLRGDNLDRFLYFYAFFRQAAFTSNWLREIREGSVSFAQRLSESLEEQVYDALELIAQGFLTYRRNRLSPTPDVLQTVYEQSLVLLYRLLFIFYAESRDILPTYHELYVQRHSLDSIKQSAVHQLGVNGKLSPDKTEFYTRVSDLFFSIDQGDERFDLPPYNGRLFAETDHPFLASKAVGDGYFVPALEKLARIEDQDTRRREFVDYRDLDVRHLGAIYEKLLEYQLDIAAEPLTLRDGKYVPARSGDPVIKKPGEVYLRTGNHERKITGSYYTPDYIVRFIVEHTLKPLLTEIAHRHATRDIDGLWQVHDPAGLRAEIMALNILDPATGSGHFLVDAAAYIAEWLRDLGLAPADLETDEDELIYWKRQVVNACIYGVDVNPLAVELARLSLWLATLARGKPLSFLDHHIKCGNSLVGARVRDIGAQLADLDADKRSRARQTEDAATGQNAMWDDEDFAPALSFAVGAMADIESTAAETVDKVKQQEQMYARLSEELAVWKRIADVWLARYFGLALSQDTWVSARAHLLAPHDKEPEIETVLEQAAQFAREQRFLHWELEFPEIFFRPDSTPLENPGFDAVIGNPPYVRQERIQPIKPYLAAKYAIYQGTADLFLYFYELGLGFLKQDQRLGYITSSTYMNSNSAKEFRRFIHQAASFESVIDFGAVQPFKGAEMPNTAMISVLRKGNHGSTFRSLFIEGRRVPDSLEEALEKEGADCPSDAIARDEWRFQSVALMNLFEKVMSDYPTLEQVIKGKVYRGITTGLNDAFIVDSETRQQLIRTHPSSIELLRPMRRGEDLRPWYQIDSQLYLVFAYQGINIGTYPAIKEHLEQFQDALSKRWEPAHGQCQWYELRPCDYYDEFEKPKIYWAEITRFPRFSWDSGGLYASNKAHMLIPSSISLLGLLQSRVLWFCISQIATPLNLRLGLWRYQLLSQFVERLPIPDLTADQESQLAEIAETITTQARQRYQLHETMRHRIAADLGRGGKLNQRLEAWWLLEDGAALRREVQKAFAADIPLAERDEWEKYLAAQRVSHQQLTDEIIRLETQMNAIVYAAFKLTPDEITLIERSTKYPYGEV